MSTTKEREREEAATKLRETLKPGDIVYTVLRHRSASGMSRAIDCYVIRPPECQPWRPSRLVARAVGFRFDEKREAISVGGAGMDMGFHVVYSLSSVLFRGGFECIGKDCPSNDHSNGDRNYEPHHHGSGGYALRHAWI